MFQGMHIAYPNGTTGFVDPSVLHGVVGPLTHPPAIADDRNKGDLLRQRHDRDELWKRVQISRTPEGNWHAVDIDATRNAEIVSKAAAIGAGRIR